jgi:hypothetical protein
MRKYQKEQETMKDLHDAVNRAVAARELQISKNKLLIQTNSVPILANVEGGTIRLNIGPMTYALDEENALLLRDWLSDMLAVVPVPVAVIRTI